MGSTADNCEYQTMPMALSAGIVQPTNLYHYIPSFTYNYD